ncbi:MAG: BamA/TamA family outer membrane protein [Gemmatimonadota bacterium]
MVAGPGYGASAFYQLLAGAGYRDLWTAPIRVPVADLSRLGGGLTARRVGGGMTTKTLHLDGADGRRYVLRSVDKVPADLIAEFEGTLLEDVLQDQISAFHPSSALVVAPLLDAVGVLHVTPTLVVVPDDPRLGDFRSEFAGMLALFEERPDDPPEGAPGFGGSIEVVQTDRLFAIMEEQTGHRVARDELLRARLVDLIVGDRDRSTNNHLFARFADGEGGALWRPIPRDRDQAFVRFDGLLKGFARYYDRRLVQFESEYPNVFGLTRNAWDIDRSFLVSMSRAEWDSVVSDVRARLTDAVIDDAVRMMPREHYELVGERLAPALRRRRDNLVEAADELYRIVFESPDITLSDADEDVTIRHLRDGSVQITGVVVGPQGDATTSYTRTFVPDETLEVRVYLQGGDDRAVVVGNGPGSIKVRVMGGGGRDELHDSSGTPGVVNLFYDGGGGTVVTDGPSTRFHRRDVERRFSWHEESRWLDWGTFVVPEARFGYDEDRGLVLIGGVKVRQYGFLKDPYAMRLQLRAGWAVGARTPIVDYRHFWQDMLGETDVFVRARWSGLEVMNFFGLGNQVPLSGAKDYHKVRHESLEASIAFSVGDGETRVLSVGPVFEFSRSDTVTAASFVGVTDPYGSGGFAALGLQTDFVLDGRDSPGAPTSGYLLDGGARFVPEVLDVRRGSYGEVHATAATYVSPAGGNPVLAVRAAGKMLWGAYPFAQAAFLGGSGSVRGLPEQRFAGDASLNASAELRVQLARVAILFPSDVGVFALGDMGRVYLSGEVSDSWHTAYGGGVWIAPIRRESTVQISLARSGSGETRFYAGVGFAY